MSMKWAVKEKDERGSGTDQRSPECYYNRHAWPIQGNFDRLIVSLDVVYVVIF